MKKTGKVKFGCSVYLSEREEDILNLIIECTKYENEKDKKFKIQKSQVFRHLLGFVITREEIFQEFANYLQININLDEYRRKIQIAQLDKGKEEKLIEIQSFLEEMTERYKQLIFDTIKID